MSDFRSAWRETLRTLFTAPRFLTMFFLLIGGVALSAAIYAHFVVRGLPIVAIDEDRSSTSRTLIRYLDATRELDLTQTEPTLEEAQHLLETGAVSAVLLIPSDFSAELKKGRSAELFLAVDTSNILTGKTAWRAVSKVTQTLAAGIRLTTVKKLGERREKAMARALPITVVDDTAFNPAANYANYLTPGLAFFFVHLWLLIVAASLPISTSRKRNVAARLGERALLFTLGLLFSLILIYGVFPQVEIYNATTVSRTLVILVTFLLLDLLFVEAVRKLFAFSTLFSLQATVLVGVLSFMFSGTTWPTDMFPLPIALFSFLIPFTPFAKAMRTSLFYPVELPELFPMMQMFLGEALFFLAVILLSYSVARLWRHLRRSRA